MPAASVAPAIPGARERAQARYDTDGAARMDGGGAAAVDIPEAPMTTRGPLHVLHASIRDFRGIEELELDFPEGDAPGEGGVMVLGGDNGSGKTSVLEALALGLGQGDLLPPGRATLAEQVRFGCRDFTISLKIARGDQKFALTSQRGILEQPVVLRTPDMKLGLSRHHMALGIPGSAVTTVPNGPFWNAIERWAPRVVYHSARRDADGLPTSGGDVATLTGDSRRIAELKKTLISLYVRQHLRRPRANGDVDRFERLQRFVRRFLGDDATVDVMFVDDSDRNGQEVVLRRGELPDGVETLADARARAKESADVPVVLPIDHLSSGQLALFAFVEPLLFHESPPDLALIDEPERHLHVQWQRVIVSALHELSPSTQLVVATHAPDIMRSVTSEELTYLLPRNDPRRPAPAHEAELAR